MYNPTTNKLEQQVYKFSVGTKYRTCPVLILGPVFTGLPGQLSACSD